MRLAWTIIVLLYCMSCTTDQYIGSGYHSFNELSPLEHGIDFTNDLQFSADINIIEYLYFNNGGGVAIGDIDNDGLEDVFLTANQKPDKLYRNLGDLRFEDISEHAGISILDNWSSGVTIDDIDGDGWNDIYVVKVAPVSRFPTHNELYINQQDGTFKEMSAKYGLDFSGYSTQASFFDYDLDGDLDVYLLNHSVHSIRSYGNIALRKQQDELSGDRIYENRINELEGSFIDVTAATGIYSSALGYGLALITTDLNSDGLIDIYVGNDFHENDYLYINNGDKTFTESIDQYISHSSQYTMGVDAADINGDGFKDLYTTDMMPYDPGIMMRSGGNDTKQVADIKKDYGFLTQYARNHMQVYQPSLGRYIEEALISKVYASDWSWSVLLQDFDNSGSTDIYISNGIIDRPNDLDYINYINTPSNRQKGDESTSAYHQRLIDQMPTLRIPNLLFSQDHLGRFTSLNDSKLGEPNYSNGTAYADLDLDGDLDIICNNVNGPISLIENQIKNNHFIAVSTPIKNSLITVYADGQKQTKEYLTTRGFQSSSTHYVHFGLGMSVSKIDSIVIELPNGDGEMFTDINSDEYIHLEVSNASKILSRNLLISPMVQMDTVLMLGSVSAFDDIDREPLIPLRMSRLSLAATIIDDDDHSAIYIGGDSKSNGQIWQHQGQHAEDPWAIIDEFVDSLNYTDVDAAQLDFNRDGYNDLYVVSGGNYYPQLNPNNEDRLYLNDGHGSMIRYPISLPPMNGSSVAVADFDGDGFMDLFVGSASVPGGYGDSPVSFILRNVEGAGLDIAFKSRLGMITDSKWVNIDHDVNPELVLVGHWMAPIILDYSDDGTFRDISSQYVPHRLDGMYNCIELADINHDGQVDFLLGNIGSNVNWSTSDDRAIELYLADFDNNSSLDPIIFNNYSGAHIPFLDKAILQSQVPSLRKAFTSFEDFSTVRSIQQLFPEIDDRSLLTKQIYNLESIALISSVDKMYTVQALPRELQLTTINDMLYIDSLSTLVYGANSDGHSHNLGNTMSNGVGKVHFSKLEEHQVVMNHDFIPIPIGSVVKKILLHHDNDLILVTNHQIISFKFL